MIKLTKSDSADGQHHFIEADLVDHIDAHVHLSKPADEVMATWESDDSLELDDDEGATEIKDNEEKEQEDWIERRR
jgi:hypothetical protein